MSEILKCKTRWNLVTGKMYGATSRNTMKLQRKTDLEWVEEMIDFILDYIGNFYSSQAPQKLFCVRKIECEIIIRCKVGISYVQGYTGLQLGQELKRDAQDLAFGSIY